jgi:hypothetical protein
MPPIVSRDCYTDVGRVLKCATVAFRFPLAFRWYRGARSGHRICSPMRRSGIVEKEYGT